MTTLAQLTGGQIVGYIALWIGGIVGVLIAMSFSLGPVMMSNDKRIALEEFSTKQAAREWFDHKWGQGAFDRTRWP